MYDDVISAVNTLPDIQTITWKLLKRFWYIIFIPILVGIVTIKIGWYQNNTLLLNIGVISLCIALLITFLGLVFYSNTAQKIFIKSLAEKLGYQYFENDVVFGLKSIFLNIRKDIFNYTTEEAQNLIGGKYIGHDIKLYRYSMGVGIDRPATAAGSARYFHFFVSELKINHSIPNVIFLPRKGFAWPRKYTKNQQEVFSLAVQNSYYIYPANNPDSKELINKIVEFVATKDSKIGIEFCGGRIILFKSGRKVNKEKVKNSFEIVEYILSTFT